MKRRFSFFTLLLSPTLLVPFLPSQDPPVPPGRFSVQTKLNQIITWSDGYKTTLDIYVPKAKPPKTGWPSVLIVHGKSGNRAISENRLQARYFTGFGYASFAYDVRGDGSTKTLNPPGGDLSADALMRDMAEVFSKVSALVPGQIDLSRLAVTGRSMGGSHAYRAAAWSGKPLLKAGPIKVFPKIRAVAGDWQVLNKLEDFLPAGTQIQTGFLQSIYQDRLNNPSYWNLIQRGQLAQLRGLLTKNPYMDLMPGLQKNKIPILAILGYRDTHHMVANLTEPFAQFTGFPHRLYLSTRGHRLPNNDTEFLLHMDLKRRFWDRFMKGKKNGVELEPFAEVGILPSSPLDYANTKTQWKHVQFSQWPPTLPQTVLFLGSKKNLSNKAPSSKSLSPQVQNNVRSGYTVADFAQGIQLPKVLPNIPLSRITFQGGVLGKDRTLLGRAHFYADIKTGGGAVQLNALLYDIPPSGKPIFVTMGSKGLGRVGAGTHRVQIQLDDIAFTFPKGHRIGLALQNLAIRETIPTKPKDPYLYLAPEFGTSWTQVIVGGSYPARLDLPLSAPPSSLLPRVAELSFGTQLSYPFKIQTQYPGAFSYILMGGSGIGPGLIIPPYLPLNLDLWTTTGISLMGTPILQGFLSVLDAKGEARMRFQVPATFKKEVIGRRFTFAPLIFHKTGVSSGSPSELLILP
jgi:predicted acyl esterase